MNPPIGRYFDQSKNIVQFHSSDFAEAYEIKECGDSVSVSTVQALMGSIKKIRDSIRTGEILFAVTLKYD